MGSYESTILHKNVKLYFIVMTRLGEYLFVCCGIYYNIELIETYTLVDCRLCTLFFFYIN